MTILAANPEQWLATHFEDYFTNHLQDNSQPHRSLTVADLLADNAVALRELHQRLTDDGTEASIASRRLADWFGGLAARAIGYACVAADAGFIVEPANPCWLLSSDDRPDCVELGEVSVLVPLGHPWMGLYNVDIVRDDERHQRSTEALVAMLAPLVEALALLGGDTNALWNEVANGLATALVYQERIPVTDEGIAVLRAMIDAPGAPWTERPSIERERTGALG